MLYSLDDTVNAIRTIPHRREYRLWRSRLRDGEYEAIIGELHRVLDGVESGKRVLTSSYVPGRDWEGTVYQVIYDKACMGSKDHSGKCFGLFMWDAVMRHDKRWFFMKSEDVMGTVYFREGL